MIHSFINFSNKLLMHGNQFPIHQIMLFYMRFYVKQFINLAVVCIGLGLVLILTAPSTP